MNTRQLETIELNVADSETFSLKVDVESGKLLVHLDNDCSLGQLREVRGVLGHNLNRLKHFQAREDHGGEYDLSIIDNEIVFWELEDEGQYELSTEQRTAAAVFQIRDWLEVIEVVIKRLLPDVVWHDWKEDGF